MSTFLLTWDGSEAGYPLKKYAADIAATASGNSALGTWSFGTRRSGAVAGDRVFLLRQKTQRGIVASGRLVTGEVYEDRHWEDPSKTTRYIEVDWDRVAAVEDRLPIEELLGSVPGHQWNAVFSSGQELDSATATEVETRWAARIAAAQPKGAWTLPVGSTLSRRARSQQFGGGLYGGIEPSATSPNVFVYSDPHAGTAYGYDYDGWSEDGSIFLYTGEGRSGDQKLRDGNLAVLRHAEAGRALRLFVADGTEAGSDAKIHRYVGEFRVDPAEPYVQAEAPDSTRNARAVFVFRLQPVGAVLRRPQDESDTGDAHKTPELEPVSPQAVAATEGSAEGVPIEVLGTRSYTVAGSMSKTAVKWEAELVARYQAHLETLGRTCLRYRIRPSGELRDLYTDILDATENVLYEAKGVATREAVRMAIGQLLDYSRHIPTGPALALLLPTKPSADLMHLLRSNRIRCVYEAGPSVFIEDDPP